MIETLLFQSNFAYEGVNNDAVLSKHPSCHFGFWKSIMLDSVKLPRKAKSGERGCQSIPFYLILHKVILVYQLQIDGQMDSALLLVSTRRYLIYAQ